MICLVAAERSVASKVPIRLKSRLQKGASKAIENISCCGLKCGFIDHFQSNFKRVLKHFGQQKSEAYKASLTNIVVC